jgi:hypothetical protein
MRVDIMRRVVMDVWATPNGVANLEGVSGYGVLRRCPRNLSHYASLEPDMNYSEGQKCIEACGKPLPADDEAAAFCLEAGIRPLRVAAESPYVARPASAAVLAKPVSETVPGYLAGSITGAGFGAVPLSAARTLGR